MQRLRVEKWCDICFEQDEQYVVSTGSYTISISVGGKTPMIRSVDVCDDHDSSIQQFRSLIHKVGYTPRPSKNDARPEEEKVTHPARGRSGTCPDCGLALKHGVPGHLQRVHGWPQIKQPARCPDCKWTAATENGMRIHRTKAHGYNLTADMMAAHAKGRRK
jgi:hypothetical protein